MTDLSRARSFRTENVCSNWTKVHLDFTFLLLSFSEGHVWYVAASLSAVALPHRWGADADYVHVPPHLFSHHIVILSIRVSFILMDLRPVLWIVTGRADKSEINLWFWAPHTFSPSPASSSSSSLEDNEQRIISRRLPWQHINSEQPLLRSRWHEHTHTMESDDITLPPVMFLFPPWVTVWSHKHNDYTLIWSRALTSRPQREREH